MTPKEQATNDLCALLLGLTNDLSFATQCDAMRNLLAVAPHAGITPAFIRWEQKHTARLKQGVALNRGDAHEQAQTFFNL